MVCFNSNFGMNITSRFNYKIQVYIFSHFAKFYIVSFFVFKWGDIVFMKKFHLLVLSIFILSIVSVNGYVTIDIIKDRCWEREGTSTSGYPDGTNLCDTPFNVDTDNNLYETTSSGNNNYAEIRTAHNFNPPKDCTLLSVEACVDFYSGNVNLCTGVEVSNDGGSSWSTSFGTCPTSDQGIVCYDVTSLRTWASNCSDFQNNQSEVFIELEYKGNNDLTTDYVRFKVNYTTPPNITTPQITPYKLYNNVTINCSTNVTDGEEDPLLVNFTWYQNGVRNTSFDSSVLCANNTVCYTSVAVLPSDITIGHNWTCSAIAYDGYVSGAWRNSTEKIVINRKPFIYNLTANNNNTIDLVPAQNKTIICNGSVVEKDGFVDILSIDATLYSTDLGKNYLSPDNRSNHYTNSSCTFTNNPGNEQIYTCAFSVDYYAVNGSWECRVEVTDYNNSVHSLIDSAEINPLTAIGVNNNILDFDQLQAGGTSPEKTLNFINYGNINFDVEFFAFANTENDELAMDCEQGDIPLLYERFNLTSGVDYNLMSPVRGKSDPILLDVDISRKIWSGPDSLRAIYWKLRIPSSREGVCNGKLIFTAIPS